MKNNAPLVPLSAAALTVVAFCTLVFPGGWLTGFPTLLALAVVYYLVSRVR